MPIIKRGNVEIVEVISGDKFDKDSDEIRRRLEKAAQEQADKNLKSGVNNE